ncbi:MAG TPA: hypothetical protein VH595_18940 [Verrucomicrobiae bacterium]|nr:hypothetical protein [Verrucomicrobiae bacterium]
MKSSRILMIALSKNKLEDGFVLKWWLSAVGIVVLGLFFFLIYRSTDEPVYHSRSVTQWLDRMAMFDEMRTMDEEERHSFRIVYPPEVVSNDPALRALLAIGSKAVPTLEKTLSEPPRDPPNPPPGDPILRVKSWTAEIWRRLQGGGPGAAVSAPLYYNSFHTARMAAAGLAMLALGTNNKAGAFRLIEVTSAARSKGYPRTELLGSFSVANAGLPERRKEIIAEIVAALNSTNLQIQFIACQATQYFHTNLPEWKNKLMELAQGPDVNISLPFGVNAYVSQAALWSLATAGKGDADIVDLCQKVVQDKTRPARMRSFAAAGLGMAGTNAAQALPVLRAVLTEEGIPKGSGLQHEARQAIDRIEKSIAGRNLTHDP